MPPSLLIILLNRYSVALVLFLANLLAVAFACQRFLHTLLLARFQVKRVTLDLLDNVFRLHFSLKTAQRIFKGFAFLHSNLCQDEYTSKPAQHGSS